VLVGIDHLVIAVLDLDDAVARLRARLGIVAGGGGIHPSLGTANRLAWFGDSYLELITVTDRERATESWLGGPTVRILDERGGGFVAYALASDDLPADLARYRAEGSALVGPIPGERRRPDGAVVRWTLAVPSLVGPTAPPFLIEHDMSGAEWSSPDRAIRATAVHPAGGALRLTSLEIPMVDPARVAAAYRQAIGLTVEPWLGGGDWTLATTVGPQRIVLAPVDRTTRPSVVIRLSATAGSPAQAVLFGCRFVIDPVGPD
jgi:hypothetical protein